MSRVLTIEEFAEMYSLNPATVRTNVTRNPGSLPPVMRIGRSVRFLRSEVELWEQKMMKRA